MLGDLALHIGEHLLQHYSSVKLALTVGNNGNGKGGVVERWIVLRALHRNTLGMHL